MENLGQKQLVTAGTLADTDVVGYGETEAKACFAVLHFSGGNLLDKEYEVFPRPDDKTEAVSSLLKQFYLSRGLAPKRVLLPFEIDDAELFAQLLEQRYGPDDKTEAVSSLLKQFYLSRGLAPKRVLLPFEIDDAELFAQLLEQRYARRPKLHVPQRGLKQFYLSRGLAPKRVLLPFEIDDAELFAQLLEQRYARRPKLHVPQRGDNVRLVELACKNAYEEAQRVTGKEERANATVALLGKMLGLEDLHRMESFDISNISGTDIVASMVVFQDGRPKKSDYKRFKVEGLDGQDDYGSMRQVLLRRFTHYKAGDTGFSEGPKRFKVEGLDGQDDYGSMRQVLLRRFTHYKAGDTGFSEGPDLLLIDGGVNHAKVAEDVLQELGSMRQVLLRRFTHYKAGDTGFSEGPDLLLIDGGVNHAKVAEDVLQELALSFPVFGMVKDDRHRTRALVTAQGREIRIDNNQAVFALIGSIQEETHRFAITYHRQLRSKRLRYSELDGIAGIGPKRKQDLLRQFKSLTAIAQATLPELERLLPKDAALAVYQHFQEKREQ